VKEIFFVVEKKEKKMKFQVQTVAAITLLASGVSAFCPAPISTRPVSDLSMVQGDVDMGKKAAMSFMAASLIAVSSSTSILPVEPAFAAPTATTTEKTQKVDLKKLAPEERNKILAKQNLDLSEQTLKEYTKFATEAKAADAKASTALKAQEKIVAAAKKTVISDSDRLSAAKNQQMPKSAITELSIKAAQSKDILKTEEKKLADLAKTASKASSDLKSAEKGLSQSKDAIKNAKKKLEKAEKAYKDYTKKVQDQKKKEVELEKKAKAAAQKALQDEEKKVRALEAEQKRLASIKESSEKELEKKAKLLEAEKKALEKLKSTTK